MRIRITRIAGWCLAGLLQSHVAIAESETLEEAWRVALDAHQQIAAAQAQSDAARFVVESANAERYPRLEFTGGYTQLDTAPRFAFGQSFVSPKIFSNDDFVTATAQLSIPVYTSGLISAGIEAAESTALASQWRLEALKQDIKLGVAGHFIDVLRAGNALAVVESSVQSLSAHSADTRNRYERGAVPHNDYLAASVSLANAEQDRLEAIHRLELANAAYNRFLGRLLTAPVSLNASLPGSQVVAGLDLEQLTKLALENRSELLVLESRAEALRARSGAERARNRPQLALTGGYTMLENQVLDEERFWSVGVVLNWSPFDSGRSRSRADALDREADAVMHEREDLRTLISLEVREAWLDAEEAASRGEVSEAAVEQANENLRVTRDRYRAGAGTNTEVLDAEMLRARSLNNRDNARYDLALARFRLARAAGKL